MLKCLQQKLVKFWNLAEVEDVSGKTIYKNSIQNANGQMSFPVNLQPGMYVLMVETNNERKAIKFIR